MPMSFNNLFINNLKTVVLPTRLSPVRIMISFELSLFRIRSKTCFSHIFLATHNPFPTMGYTYITIR
jgi:hypothetical protein